MSSVAHKLSGASFEASPELPPVMPEVDLLPAWYPQLWRRRRWLTLQWWLTVGLVVLLLAVLVWWRARVEATHVELASIEMQRRSADETLSEVVAQEARLSMLQRQAEMLARMGLPLEVSRVLADIDAAAPKEIALTAIEVHTESKTLESRRGPIGSRPVPVTVRQMTFSLKGLTERREAAYAFAEALRQQRRDYLLNVVVHSTQPERIYGRAVDLFEIRFRVDLATGDSGALSSARGAP